MKNMKKLFSLVLALVMVMGLTVAAGAQTVGDPNDATITIANASKGVKYTVYQVFGATVDTEVLAGSPDNAKKGINYTFEGTLPESLSSVFKKVEGTNYVQVIDGKSDEEVLTAAQAYAKTQSPMYNEVENTDGGAMVFNVPYGYYVIISNLVDGTNIQATVDSTTPNATVYDKNSVDDPEFNVTDGKKADDTVYYLGETATYTVTLKTVNWVGAGKDAKQVVSYTFTDDAAQGKLENLKVTSITVDGVALTDLDGNAYTAENMPNFVNGELTIPWVKGENSRFETGVNIVITYTAKVVAAGDIENTVSATYKVKGDETPKDVENDPKATVHTAKMTVTKTDSANKPLAGAGFVLRNEEGKYYKKSDDGKSISWVSLDEEPTELMSTVTEGVGNEMVFDGLGEGTYTLVENTVPNGYNKAADEEFTVADNDVTTENLSQARTVVNNTGTELPATGGIGTTIFTVVGGVLMIGAAILFLTKKRSEV